MNMRILVVEVIVMCLSSAIALDNVEVSDVQAQQRYPWNGMVDVSFTASGVVEGKNRATVTVCDLEAGTNVLVSTLIKSGANVTNGLFSVAPGENALVWDAQQDMPKDFLSQRMQVDVAIVPYSYAVKFNANGGTGTMTDETFDYGTTRALSANSFTRTGYTFTGWAKTSSGSVAYTNKQTVANLSGTDAATVNLYAVWKSNSYTVKFNANGGSGTMANEPFTYGTAKALTANAFTRTGYTFSGWSKTATGAVAYTNKQSVLNLSASDGSIVNLYAIWEPALYMVIDLSGGTGATSYPVSYLNAVPSGGWTDTYKTTKMVLRYVKAGSNAAGGKMSKDMWVGIFEVTGRQYCLVKGTFSEEMGGGLKYSPSTTANAAVGCMDTRANNFLSTLKSKAGISARLPTALEWQYACRAGTKTDYNNGTSATSANMSKVGWHSGNIEKSATKPGIVGKFVANAWGLFDMHGNVYEKVSDDYYVAGGGGTYHCGGGYMSAMYVEPNYSQCTSAYKDGWENKSYFMFSGLRVFAEIK